MDLKRRFCARNGSKKLQFLDNVMDQMIDDVELVIAMVKDNDESDYITRNNEICYKEFDAL